MMPQNFVQKIMSGHLVSGEMKPGTEIGIRIDQTLTQDATGTMADLQFETMGIERVKTKLSVSYVDHNMLQVGYENADDHRFLQSFAAHYGLYFSRPGNGICHQVHLERFSVPGDTLLGADSHTPTSGGAGMLAIGAGGLDVAVAMGGGPFYTMMPKIVGVRLTGKLGPWVAAKDVILEMLRRLTVKGGVGKVFEYYGSGAASLTVPERGTICNMGAELGATTSIFPSDAQTERYLKAQGRGKSYKPLAADEGATYDENMEIDLSALQPLIARPSSPDKVVPISELKGLKVSQVCVGSCTNSSYPDLMTVAGVLKGKTVHPDVSLTLTPGSKQVYSMIAQSGALTDFIAAGARVLESACGPCIGMGQAPASDAISLRTFNRNFSGRSGTADDKVFLVSPEVAAAAALTGEVTDPRTLSDYEKIEIPDQYVIADNMIIPPPADGSKVEILRGPNIKSLQKAQPMPDELHGQILLKMGDNISTDHILPGGAKVLPLRSNLPAISEYTFERVDPSFAKRARKAGGGFVVGGSNYGQGSSREHAAMAPGFLGVKVVVAKSFARIHAANLVNFGILPLTFAHEADYDGLGQGDEWEIKGIRSAIASGNTVIVHNITQNRDIEFKHSLTPRQVAIVLDGGLLNHIRKSAGQ
jgi:aconitate hydratase